MSKCSALHSSVPTSVSAFSVTCFFFICLVYWFDLILTYLLTYLFALAILTGGEVKYESNFNFYFPDGKRY